MSHVVALLDVDHTLLFDDEINQELLNALKRQRITDIYLFTDMFFTTSSIQDRKNLIDRLEAQGFNVHGVLTPADLAWDIPKEEAEGLLTSWPKRFEGEAFLTHIKENYPALSKRIAEGYDPTQCIPGSAFKAAIAEYQTAYSQLGSKEGKTAVEEGVLLTSKETTNISTCAKIIAGLFQQSCQANYTHVKGLMLDCFINNLPQGVKQIIVADDNDKVNDTILNFKPVREKTDVPPIKMLHVKGLSDKTWCDLQLSDVKKPVKPSKPPRLSQHRARLIGKHRAEEGSAAHPTSLPSTPTGSTNH